MKVKRGGSSNVLKKNAECDLPDCNCTDYLVSCNYLLDGC
jgi:hypothetical protein